MRTVHDALFRATFQHARHAVGWLRSVLPPVLQEGIEWNSLRVVSDRVAGLRLWAYAADVVFTARLRGSRRRVLIVVEHKSYGADVPMVQVLRYAVHLAATQLDKDGREPLVIAILVHHGQASVRTVAADAEIDLPRDVAECLLPRQPRLGFFVDDLTLADEAALRRFGTTALAQLTLLALRLLRSAGKGCAPAMLDRWGDLLRAVAADTGPPSGAAAIESFLCYVLEVTDITVQELDMTLQKHLPVRPDGLVTTGQRLRAEGRAEGRTEGRTEGRSEGRTEGMAAVLLRQLQRRFGALPAAVQQRLATASAAELERWSDRVLDADSLAAMFDDPNLAD
jgi:hypothetical protein